MLGGSIPSREEVRMPTALDPVCDMEVDTADPPGGTFEYDGTTYFFCSPSCREEFAGNPAAYLERA
jgi:YHS domain-containing protein